MQIPILNGTYTDEAGDFRTSYPRNLIPVPKDTDIAKGYLRPSDGIQQVGDEVPGIGRGGINWQGQLYRVLGTKLVSVAEDGTYSVLGDVGEGGRVTMDYSFDVLGIAAGGSLYYWDGSTLEQVLDTDLGTVVRQKWIAGYWLTTDGKFLIVTELDDRMSVNPLKYGSSEADPDPVLSVDELRNEAYALNRYTIEAFQNIGGTGFPFQRIEGAQVPKGIIGTHAYAKFLGTFAFLGSGRNEPPGIYLVAPGDTVKLSTREVDQILAKFTEADLSTVIVETKIDKAHQHLMIHLPDRCLVYDGAASQVVGAPVWFTLTTSITGEAQYRAINHVWCYNRWNCEDPQQPRLGFLVDTFSYQWNEIIGWEFATSILYNGGNSGVVHNLELVALTGRVRLGKDPVIWTSYSNDGETWSQERAAKCGKQGERNKRIAWRTQGQIRHWRVQRFRGTSDAHVSVTRLEAQIEALNG